MQMPTRGDLVSVRIVESYENEEGKEVFVCQIRRGLVLAVVEKGDKPPLYSVYMLDFGGKMLVGKAGVLPLPKPFDCVTPLAIKCALFGVSPVGEKWQVPSAEFFQQEVEQRKELVFSVEVMSKMMNLPTCAYPKKVLLVNLEARKLLTPEGNETGLDPPLKLDVNFGEKLVKEKHGLAWNLFPARPRLMKGAQPGSGSGKKSPELSMAISHAAPQLKLSMGQGVLMTPHYPRACNRLPMPVEMEKREVEKLFGLRREYLVDVLGADNRLMLRIPEKNPQMPKGFEIPCTSWEWLQPAEKNRVKKKKNEIVKVEEKAARVKVEKEA